MAIIGGMAWRHHAQRNAWGHITFTTYAPIYLPDALKVASASIDARYIPAGTPAHSTMLHLALPAGSYIYEQKNAASVAGGCPNVSIVHQTCTVMASSRGQQYALTTTQVPGQPIEQTAVWLKSSTLIQASFRGQSSQPYSADTFGRIIDSFQPAQYKNLKTNYYDSSRV